MDTYLRSRQQAIAMRRYAEAEVYKAKADECYERYLAARDNAKVKIINEWYRTPCKNLNSNRKNNPLKRIDLHGLTASEAIEYVSDSLKLLRGMRESGELEHGSYTFTIVTVRDLHDTTVGSWKPQPRWPFCAAACSHAVLGNSLLRGINRVEGQWLQVCSGRQPGRNRRYDLITCCITPTMFLPHTLRLSHSTLITHRSDK